MKGRPIDQLVYEQMFPKPRGQDPPTFHGLLQRHLIYEVRQEVHSFYGHLDTPEAKYPGLDYCHPIHRIRLSRWPWHRRLFRAFDALRLTPAEIAGLTKWEGTKWAKERYEREQGIVIRDTAADDFADFIEPEDRPSPTPSPAQDDGPELADEEEGDESMDSDGEEELESVGVALNERLRERVAMRNGGDTTMPLDDEWEQWLKSLMEAEDDIGPEQFATLTETLSELDPLDYYFPPRLLMAARHGMWEEVPEVLHDILRQCIADERRRSLRRRTSGTTAPSGSSSRTPAPSATTSSGSRSVPYAAATSDPSINLWRRTYSNLRLPVSQTRTNGGTSSVRLPRAAQAPGA